MRGKHGFLTGMLFFALSCTFCSGLPARPWRSGHRASQRRFIDDKFAKSNNEKTFLQTLDHFGVGENRTWLQRYWINASVFTSNVTNSSTLQNVPIVFVCVGGEGPAMTANVVKTGENHCGLMVTLAGVHGALILALEHRYYGQSMPTLDLSTPNLRFLSADQALGDLAKFREEMQSELTLPATTKWVLFGGSYPGMLAAWGRSKYPHLFHAAVSSSSPLQASAAMPQYNDIVARSLSRRDVGGSPACVRRIDMAFQEFAQMLATVTGQATLASIMNICGGAVALGKVGGPETASDNAAAVFEVQSNDPSCTEEACNIQKMCEIMNPNATSSPLVQLAELNRIVRNGSCVPGDFSQIADSLLNTTIAGGGERVWFYQTCTEFGFYQTCDPGTKCPFLKVPHLNNLQSYFDLCQMAFGVNGSMTESRVLETNREFGGLDISATRILFVNGDIDPWHALSPLKPGMPAFLVRGASHHFWTHPPKPTDYPEILRARQKIGAAVEKWLSTDDDMQQRKPMVTTFKGTKDHDGGEKINQLVHTISVQ